MLNVIQAQVLMCVEFSKGPSLPSCLQLLLFSLSQLLWGLYLMSSVLLSPLLQSSISILSLSVFLKPELCPFLLSVSLLNVLLCSFTLEVGISIVKPCPCVPNSTVNFCTDRRNSWIWSSHNFTVIYWHPLFLPIGGIRKSFCLSLSKG